MTETAANKTIEMKPINFEKIIEAIRNTRKEPPIATANRIRNLPFIPINSNGLWSPLKTLKEYSLIS